MVSYKQNKFNLLREQSEGYTKLSTELIHYIGPPHNNSGFPVEDKPAIEARARGAWDKIIGLIGYFDLDPSRALDIILDVLSTHVMMHYAFFLEFLRVSSWRRTLLPQVNDQWMKTEKSGGIYQGKNVDEILLLAEGRDAGRFKHPGKPQVCAEVLGFKFAYYQVCHFIYSLLFVLYHE